VLAAIAITLKVKLMRLGYYSQGMKVLHAISFGLGFLRMWHALRREPASTVGRAVGGELSTAHPQGDVALDGG
jgi:hypothetical protein